MANPFAASDLGPTTQLDPVGSFSKGFNVGNAMTTAGYNAEKMNAFRQDQQMQMDEAKRKKMIETIKSFYGPSAALDAIYNKALQTTKNRDDAIKEVQKYYVHVRDRARQEGLQASDDFIPEQNAMFTAQAGKIAGIGNEKVLGSGQLYSNPQTGKDEMWLFSETGQPKTFLRNATERDKMGVAGVAAGLTQGRAEQKEVGEYFGKSYADMLKGGKEANTKLMKLDQLESYYKNIATGKLRPAATTFAAYAKDLGIDIDPGLSDAQASQALSREMALMLRNPSGGAGMPGAMSDADREYLVSMVPSLGNDPQANKKIISFMRKIEKRNIDVANLARKYRMKHGKIDDGFEAELAAWSEKNRLFPASGTTAAPAVNPLKSKYGLE